MSLFQNNNIYKRDTCRLCGSKNLRLVLPLTPTALCDAYVSAAHVNEVQEVYPLDLFLCQDCGYIHLPYVVNPEIIYRNYIYVTTSSLGLSDHFKKYVNEVLYSLKPSPQSLVVDIGSNDGTLLRYFKDRNMRVLGIEPAFEIAQNATKSGIESLSQFFSVKLSDKIRKDYGPATIITMNNLFANIDDLVDVTRGVRNLLAPDGVFIIESSYVADMIQNMVFDFIYHEHLSYFSVKPLKTFFKRFNMELINVERLPTKGGSLRYYTQLDGGPRLTSSAVDELIKYEEHIGLERQDTFKAFSSKIDERKHKLVNTLHELKAHKKTIASYGGSATTTTLLYHFGIGNMIDYIVDDNPEKQNTFSPGYHIPVVAPEVLYKLRPDYVVVLAWRYFDPIVKKHQSYLDRGGHFIRPLPDLEIVERLL